MAIVRSLVRRSAVALICGAMTLVAGCTVFEHPVERVAPSALGWLTNWSSQPLANTKPFDLETIRPPSRPMLLGADTTLEITIWDLYEPGRPHTFPVRVTARHTIEIPLLGEQQVAGRGLPELETALAEEFRRRDLLKTPRVLVRSLDSAHFRVQVTGAVLRPGFVELSRDQSSVYDALVAAGGLKNLAGTQIAVIHRPPTGPLTAGISKLGMVVRGQSPEVDQEEKSFGGPQIRPGRQTEPVSAEPQSSSNVDVEEPAEEVAENPEPAVEPQEPTGPPSPRANRIEEVSVPLSAEKPANALEKTALLPKDSRQSNATPPVNAPQVPAGSRAPASAPITKNVSDDRNSWFDISRESDRQALQTLVLAEGDSIQVKGAAPPIRIAGAVARPGDYTLPAGRVFDLWQAVELAGGIKSSGTPLVVTLLRPPSEGHGPQRWQQQFESLDKRPKDLPKIQPGDVIDITPPTGSRLKKAVGGLWNR